jgi:diguanylate cyclase (GGDEF)-like protein/PAS domain S-box-containing protein
MWERYRALVERSADVIVVMDADGTIELVNETAETRFHHRIDELVGTNAIDLVHPDDRSRAVESLHRALGAAPGPQEPFFARVRAHDGSWLPAEIVGNNLTSDPAVGAHVVLIREITDRDRLERLMGDTEAMYRRIVETAEEGVVQVDDDLRVTFVNRRMAEMLGWERTDMVGRKVYDFMDEAERDKVQEIVRAWDEKPGPQRHQVRFQHHDGEDVWTRCSATPLENADGRLDGAVALVTDITEQRLIEEQLRYNETRLTTLFEVSSDIMAILEPDGTWHASPAGTRILGYPMGWDPEGGILSLVHPDDLELASTGVAEVLAGTRAKHEPIRLRLRHLDGHYLWFDCTAENQIDNPTVRGMIIIARDVTEQKAAEDAQAEAEARFRAAFEGSPMGVVIADLDGCIIDTNAAFCAMAGRTEDELIGVPIPSLIHPDDRERVVEESTRRVLGQSDTPPSAARLVQPDGRIVWTTSDLSMVWGPDGRPEYTILQTADVTERKKLEERLEHQAFHDPLTGIGNRAQLRKQLDAAWERRSEEGRLALLFVDLDRFKTINDTYGHEVGDEILLLVARRLERSVRAGDHLARFGGDEFVVVCEEVAGRDEALLIASRIRESLALTYRLSIGEAQVHASVGIAIDEGQRTVDDLLRDADIATYEAKELGRNRVQLAHRDAGEHRASATTASAPG